MPNELVDDKCVRCGAWPASECMCDGGPVRWSDVLGRIATLAARVTRLAQGSLIAVLDELAKRGTDA